MRGSNDPGEDRLYFGGKSKLLHKQALLAGTTEKGVPFAPGNNITFALGQEAYL